MPGLTSTIQRVKEMGIRVNEPIQTGDSVVVFGTGATGIWEVLLSDGSIFNSARDHQSMTRAASVAGFGVRSIRTCDWIRAA